MAQGQTLRRTDYVLTRQESSDSEVSEEVELLVCDIDSLVLTKVEEEWQPELAKIMSILKRESGFLKREFKLLKKILLST